MTPLSHPSRRFPLAAAALAAALTTACATTQTAAVAPAKATEAARPIERLSPSREVPGRARILKAIDLLGRGQVLPARAELALLLSEQPDDATGRTLIEQIDKDPKALLGQENYAYKVRPGETMSMLADRFLGDPLLFYALARYNGIAVPDASVAGRTLRIPGEAKQRAAPPARTARPPRPARAPATANAPASVQAPSTDPARANGLRRTALAAMSKGSIDQAVALLRQAAPLDPANPAIKSDLDRALRIQANVRNR